jgi:hypothetical protein
MLKHSGIIVAVSVGLILCFGLYGELTRPRLTKEQLEAQSAKSAEELEAILATSARAAEELEAKNSLVRILEAEDPFSKAMATFEFVTQRPDSHKRQTVGTGADSRTVEVDLAQTATQWSEILVTGVDGGSLDLDTLRTDAWSEVFKVGWFPLRDEIRIARDFGQLNTELLETETTDTSTPERKQVTVRFRLIPQKSSH